jgi:hypothetical protein
MLPPPRLACRHGWRADRAGWRAVRTSKASPREVLWPMAAMTDAASVGQCGREALEKLHSVGSVPAAESQLHFCLTICEFGIFGSEIMCVPRPLLSVTTGHSGCLWIVSGPKLTILPIPGLIVNSSGSPFTL